MTAPTGFDTSAGGAIANDEMNQACWNQLTEWNAGARNARSE